jgi:glycerol-3-phosphate acyltransferase PlsY
MVVPELWPLDRFFTELFFGQALAGLFVMLGHCFPVFYKFKGGKGIMAIGTIVIVIDWRLALMSWGVFIIVTLLTRYVSLGSMFGSIAFPSSMLVLNLSGVADLKIAELIVILLCTILVIVRHIPNIKRIARGEESKLKIKRSKAPDE